MVWLVVCLAAVGAAWFLLRRKQQEADAAPAPERKPKSKPVWGKRIVVPPNGQPCQAVMKISGQCFDLDKVPSLPLPACSCAASCLCHYELLTEQRVQPERRSGKERRPSLRFDLDAKQRRSGQDRRYKNKDLFGPNNGGRE
jgi:hypothetical protein